MPLFGFGKKKENITTPCACGGKCSTVDNARIIVLGACCKKSADTFANVRQAAQELEISEEVINIGDAMEIAKYGVMQTPALVVDGKVVSLGHLIQVDEAKDLLKGL